MSGNIPQEQETPETHGRPKWYVAETVPEAVLRKADPRQATALLTLTYYTQL